MARLPVPVGCAVGWAGTWVGAAFGGVVTRGLGAGVVMGRLVRRR